MAHIPTEEQENFYEVAPTIDRGEFLSLLAFAGAAKSSTIRGFAARMSRRRARGLALAFNRENASSVASSLALYDCRSLTMHKLAWLTMTRGQDFPAKAFNLTTRSKVITSQDFLTRFDVPSVAGLKSSQILGAAIDAMKIFCNSADTRTSEEHTRAAIVNLFGDPSYMHPGNKKEKAEDALDRLVTPLRDVAEAIYNHLLYENIPTMDQYVKEMQLRPFLAEGALSQYDYVAVDEAQDSNDVFLEILKKGGTRTFLVGDPYQQLYSWRGSVDIMSRVPGRKMTLSKSFRFGEDIAEVARHILACRPDGGPLNKLEGAGGKAMPDPTKPSIAVLCRTNAGVLEESLKLMLRGVSVKLGNPQELSEMVNEVRSAEALSCGEIDRIQSPLFRGYESWDEVKKDADEGDAILSRYVSIIEGDRARDVYRIADQQKENDEKGIVPKVAVSTVHKAKGGEWLGARLGGDFKPMNELRKRIRAAKNESATAATAAIEELNVLYVAATRGQRRLDGHEQYLFPVPKEKRELAPTLDQVPAPANA